MIHLGNPMKKNSRSKFILCLTLFTVGCVSHEFTDFQDVGNNLEEKSFYTKEALQRKEQQDLINPVVFLTRLNNNKTKLTYRERILLKRIARKTSKNAIHQAILTLGVLHVFLDKQKEQRNFIEEDIFINDPVLATPNVAKKSNGLNNYQSLEQLGLKFDIDLVSSLQSNSYLHNLDTYNLIFKAVQYEKDSLVSQKLMEIIKNKTNHWMNFAKKIQPSEHSRTTEQDFSQETYSLAEGSPVQPPLPFESSQLNSQHFDEILDRGNQHISRKEYSKALTLLNTIDENHLQYSLIDEKIKEISNLAVRELRRQAANSFGKAIPVTNLKARTAYLEKAKSLLITALKDYPKADNMDTIKQNLGIINKNLDLIRSQQKSNG